MRGFSPIGRGRGGVWRPIKVPGIRAALCGDAETVRAARIWSHATVLVLSSRLLSEDIAKEILMAWFEASFNEKGSQGVAELRALDERYRDKG